MGTDAEEPILVRVANYLVESITEIAADTYEVTFTPTAQPLRFKPGQYVRLILPQTRNQTIGADTRDMCISSSPLDTKSFSVTFRSSESDFKQTLLHLPKGSTVIVQGPLGAFTLPEDTQTPLIFIAGGIGITAFISMMRYLTQTTQNRPVTLFYANSTESKAVYAQELEKYAKEYGWFTYIPLVGHLYAQDITDKVDQATQALWYICGIPRLVSTLMHELHTRLAIPDTQFRIEEYVGYETRSGYFILPPTLGDFQGVYDDEIGDDLVEPLLEAVGQSAIVSVTDAQGSMIYVNQKFLEVSKYSRDELIGQNHRILKSGFHDVAFYKNLWETIASGKVWRGDIKDRAKDGTYFWVDTAIAPIFGKSGKIEKYISVRFLITEKKEYEERVKKFYQQEKQYIQQLEQSKEELEDERARLRRQMVTTEKFRLATKNSPNHIVLTDINGQIIFANKAASKQTGYYLTEMLGSTPRLWGGIMEPEFYKLFWHRIKVERLPFQGEITNMKKDGTLYTAFARVAPIIDENNNLVGFVDTEEDITEQKRIDRTKTEFVSLASHQLRTPLSAINWYTEMLLDQDVGDINDKQKEYLQEIATGNKRMVDLVNALLNVSRIELGTFAVSPEPIHIEEICESLLKELQQQIQEKGILLEKDFQSEIPLLNADPNLVRIIEQNLLSNAIKYTPAQGKVRIQIRYDQRGISFIVSDTGCGIPKQSQDKIFSKLYRADNAQEKDPNGNGLGLYIVKSIVDQVGGRIWFNSEENKGTTFYVALPRTGMEKHEGSKALT